MSREQIEAIVVDDHLMMRKGLEVLLRQEDMRVAGVAGTLSEARSLFERRRYDVALLDVHLGSETSIPLVQELLSRDPQAALVIYTGFTEPGKGLEAAVQAGARGFVLKSSPAPRLIEALHTVAEGGNYVDPDLALHLSQGAQVSLLALLSRREREIIELLAEGFTGHAIAVRLVLSPETVRTHVRNAMRKLGARTRVQAVALVVQARGAH